jgi:bifunctional ADP-heptose synthase (sugar kinase/adenylyltransferase)
MDPALAETSLETGRVAHQVVDIRNSPGAAGTVTNNLRALGVQVAALGVIGRDGMGYELLRGLQADGVDTTGMIEADDRFTPTYYKPMALQPDGSAQETERMDIKNRTPLPDPLEERVIAALRERVRDVDGIIVADQVPEANCGVITDRVRTALDQLALEHPDKVMAADSRVRIGAYRHLICKPNDREACLAVRGVVASANASAGASANVDSQPTLEEAAEAGMTLHRRNGRPVFVTVGAQGMLVCADGTMTHLRGVDVSGPIDIVGAGDSAMAGIAAALSAGSTCIEAGQIANLVASITIQQLGTTGTASPEEVLARWREAVT